MQQFSLLLFPLFLAVSACSDITYFEPGNCNRLIEEEFNLSEDAPDADCYSQVTLLRLDNEYFYRISIVGATCNGITTVTNCALETVCIFGQDGDCQDRFENDAKEVRVLGYFGGI